MLLDGKKALVFGVSNDWSMAWGIAKAFHEHGATQGWSTLEIMMKRARPLAERIGVTFLEPCDATDDDQLRSVFAKWKDAYGQIDVLVHSLAHARDEDLKGRFVDTTREGYKYAIDVSAYSLVALCREAHDAGLLHEGSSVMTLTYYGSEKVTDTYKVMGVAKAALEASVRYLAADLGPEGVRVNALSPGPVRTLAASGVSGVRSMLKAFPEIAPLRRNISTDDVGRSAVYLASDLSSGVTGEVIYVDAGFNVLGVATAE
jgi:enoyl-[acyl-carrier protein] reductase I